MCSAKLDPPMAQRLLFRHGSLVRPAAAAACACGLALQQRSEPSNSLFASKPSFDAVEPEKKLAQYEMGAELGQGAFGVVKIATKSGVQYALKIVKKRSKLCDAMAEKEAELLRAVSPHDNIVGLVDAFELPTEYAFVMDLARGGEACAHLLHCSAFGLLAWMSELPCAGLRPYL